MSSEVPKFSVNAQRTKLFDIQKLSNQYIKTEQDIQHEYNPFCMKSLQKYNPIYSIFFDIEADSENTISLNQKYEFIDMNTVLDISEEKVLEKPVFIKFSPLLDPIRYMIGKYDIHDDSIRTLPAYGGNAFPKLENKHNASYVDCFFSYLSSQLLNKHGFLNSIDFYGSYLAVQEKYKMNVIDDIEYLNSSPFFISHIGKLFSVTESNEALFSNYGSRRNKNKLHIKSEKLNISIENLEEQCEAKTEVGGGGENQLEEGEHELVYEKNASEKMKESSSSLSSHSTANTSNNSETNYSTEDEEEGEEEDDDENRSEDDNENENEGSEEEDEEEEEEDEDEDEEDEENESEVYCYINDFPVQMICQERCTGTIDDLFEKGEINKSQGASALFQIIMTLITYQKAFHFTHNDLHTNNIMYTTTKHAFLYYEFQGKKYKVPTYGRIYKIIDFGRGIYKFNGNVFCSDSFAVGGDGYTQYNFEPFFNESKPRLEPNYSFDLCRLGCSIYDFIIDNEDSLHDLDEFQRTIYRWCLDDNGKNVLYKKNGNERYPGFKLYKMIARSVHNHLPEKQLEYPFFNQYEVSEKVWKKINGKEKHLVMCIDKIPCYVNNSL